MHTCSSSNENSGKGDGDNEDKNRNIGDTKEDAVNDGKEDYSDNNTNNIEGSQNKPLTMVRDEYGLGRGKTEGEEGER